MGLRGSGSFEKVRHFFGNSSDFCCWPPRDGPQLVLMKKSFFGLSARGGERASYVQGMRTCESSHRMSGGSWHFMRWGRCVGEASHD